MNKMKFKGWEKGKTKTEKGSFDAIKPVIISASRSTDIPSFYSEWFMHRLEQGYVKWLNPFNKRPQYVSFEKTRVIVFWTKDAKPILKYLNEIDKRKINYYFQFTLNDYENENLEPNLPKIEERIDIFKKLSNKIGKEKVIWRFDPLILTDKITINNLLDKIYKVGEKVHKYTEKLVISFVDIGVYKKVKSNLKKYGIKYKEFNEDGIKKIAEGIQRINNTWKLKICTCAETVDLSEYNMHHNKCIDDELMIRIFNDDKDLMEFLGVNVRVGNLFSSDTIERRKNDLKDKGQRKNCGCIVSKDIGQYNTCKHLCVYCYANFSREIVNKSFKKHNPKCESIICD